MDVRTGSAATATASTPVALKMQIYDALVAHSPNSEVDRKWAQYNEALRSFFHGNLSKAELDSAILGTLGGGPATHHHNRLVGPRQRRRKCWFVLLRHSDCRNFIFSGKVREPMATSQTEKSSSWSSFITAFR